MVDELGRSVDGDQLLYILAKARRDRGGAAGPVVGTVMSNLGLEHALGELGIEFKRARWATATFSRCSMRWAEPWEVKPRAIFYVWTRPPPGMG